MMKKLIALLLAMIMVLSLVACSGQTATTPAADSTPAAEEPAKADETPAVEETPAATDEQYKIACYWPTPISTAMSSRASKLLKPNTARMSSG